MTSAIRPAVPCRGRAPSPVVIAVAVAIALWVALLGAARPAAADTLTVGMYAPSAPFPGTGARLAFATRLGEHLAAATGASRGVGRVYTRASDFTAAVRRGEVDFALVDEAYLAAAGADYRVVAVATRRGARRVAWQLVGRGSARTIDALEGKTIIVPELGGREDDFVIRALFGGDLPARFFGKIERAPDALSALATLSLQRADAACVPGGLALPEGVSRITSLPAIHWPLLVALPGTSDATVRKARDSLAAFVGGDVLDSFQPADARLYEALAARFRPAPRQGPLLPVSLAPLVNALLDEAKFAIEPSDPLRYLDLPEATPAGAAGAKR
jgi:hypothetical protein